MGDKLILKPIDPCIRAGVRDVKPEDVGWVVVSANQEKAIALLSVEIQWLNTQSNLCVEVSSYPLSKILEEVLVLVKDIGKY